MFPNILFYLTNSSKHIWFTGIWKKKKEAPIWETGTSENFGWFQSKWLLVINKSNNWLSALAWYLSNTWTMITYKRVDCPLTLIMYYIHFVHHECIFFQTRKHQLGLRGKVPQRETSRSKRQSVERFMVPTEWRIGPLKMRGEIRLEVSIHLFDRKPFWIVIMISPVRWPTWKGLTGLLLSSINNCVIFHFLPVNLLERAYW